MPWAKYKRPFVRSIFEIRLYRAREKKYLIDKAFNIYQVVGLEVLRLLANGVEQCFNGDEKGELSQKAQGSRDGCYAECWSQGVSRIFQRPSLSSLSPNWPSLERLLGTVGVSYFSRGSMRNTRYYTERITPTRVL